MTAHFHVARAHGKLDKVASLKRALSEYEFLSAYLERNSDVDGVEEGLDQVCAEMAQLLPRKIAAAAALEAQVV